MSTIPRDHHRIVPASAVEFPVGDALSVLRWEDERAAAALLARAFVDDPLVVAICEAPAAEREERMRWGFRIAIRSQCLTAQPAWMIADDARQAVGVVLVTRPRMAVQANVDVLFGLWGLLRIGLRAASRGARAARAIAEHVPRGPFTYLRTLGVAPEWHGRGVGSRLVERVIGAAAAGLPIYLETAKEQNLVFYARHGFQCIGEFRCLEVPVWRLLRPAGRPPLQPPA